uniref:Uncharacterized protein n=1 Tax=Heliothis virescens TaxID=7102 RepID=A0A2A4JS96_HELVI
MQCNQSFCGNGFTSVPQAPIYRSLGEGEVTSLTLPDGTVQFFFMPTVKWWSTGPVQCQPTYTTSANPMFANMNCGNPCNNNMGSWYIRGISNPNDQPKSCFASDYNMNCVNSGYHVKFHNDNCTSTTDLQYFYPSLRQGGFRSPCKDTAGVQIGTVPGNNTTICYEVVCAKPCNCARPMSLESLVETKLTSNTIGSADCSCDDLNKKNVDIQPKKQKENKRALKLNNTCACCESTDKTKSVDKSITTYADECICCAPTDGRQTQTRGKKKKKKDKRKQTHESLITDSIYKKCNGNDAEIWHPATPMSQKAMEDKSSETVLDSSGSSSCSCYSDE